MLVGAYHHTLDNKNRLSVPASMRDELGETFLVMRDFRDTCCLRLFSMTAWEAYIAPIKAKLAHKRQEVLNRFLYAETAGVSPDSLGRIRITKEHLRFLGMDPNEDAADRDVQMVVIGCGDYAEIWSEKEYAAYCNLIDPEELQSELERNGL